MFRFFGNVSGIGLVFARCTTESARLLAVGFVIQLSVAVDRPLPFWKCLWRWTKLSSCFLENAGMGVIEHAFSIHAFKHTQACV
jgi:hypothetical protein